MKWCCKILNVAIFWVKNTACQNIIGIVRKVLDFLKFWRIKIVNKSNDFCSKAKYFSSKKNLHTKIRSKCFQVTAISMMQYDTKINSNLPTIERFSFCTEDHNFWNSIAYFIHFFLLNSLFSYFLRCTQKIEAKIYVGFIFAFKRECIMARKY